MVNYAQVTLYVMALTRVVVCRQCLQGHQYTTIFKNSTTYSLKNCSGSDQTTACLRFEASLKTFLIRYPGRILYIGCVANSSCDRLSCSDYASDVRRINPLIRLKTDDCKIACCTTDGCNANNVDALLTPSPLPRTQGEEEIRNNETTVPVSQPAATLTTSPRRPQTSVLPLTSSGATTMGKTAETTTTSIVTSASVRSLVPPRPTTTTGSIPLTAAPSNFSCYQNETLLLNHFNRRRFKSGPCPPTSACLLLSGRVNSILSFSRLSGKVIYGECAPLSSCAAETCTTMAKKVRLLHPAIKLIEDKTCSVTCCNTINCNGYDTSAVSTTLSSSLTSSTYSHSTSASNALECHSPLLLLFASVAFFSV